MAAEKLQPYFETVKVELIPALKEDITELDFYRDGGFNAPKIKVLKMRKGLPYWLKNSSGEIEPWPYILDESTDSVSFNEYFKKGQILIAKNPFKHQ